VKNMLALYAHRWLADSEDVATEFDGDVDTATGIKAEFDRDADTATGIEAIQTEPPAKVGSGRQIAGRLAFVAIATEKQDPTKDVAETADAVTKAGELIGTVRDLSRAGRRAEALDRLYDVVDDLLLERAFDRVRWILRVARQRVEEPELPPSAFLSLLTITLPWRPMLKPDRGALLERFRRRITSERGEEAARDLLSGLA